MAKRTRIFNWKNAISVCFEDPSGDTGPFGITHEYQWTVPAFTNDKDESLARKCRFCSKTLTARDYEIMSYIISEYYELIMRTTRKEQIELLRDLKKAIQEAESDAPSCGNCVALKGCHHDGVCKSYSPSKRNIK